MSSPILENLVFGNGDDEPPSVLHLDNDSPQAFKWLLANIYMGCREFPNVEIAAAVYILAFKYEMFAVCRYCKEVRVVGCKWGNLHM